MKYFNSCKTLEELKKEFRRLAMLHHPDRGGDVETMKQINAEYDIIFPALKARYNATAAEPTRETAQSTRSEFYTANGWKGENYSSSLSLKEIAQLVRAYVKEFYPDFRFSVRTAYASMCQELRVNMTEAPGPVYKTIDELERDEVDEIIRKAACRWNSDLSQWNEAEGRAEVVRLWEKYGAQYRVISDRIKAAAAAVDAFVNSYNYDDSDGMMDYFDSNFYYFGCLQRPENVKIVPREPRRALPGTAKAQSKRKSAEQAAPQICTAEADKPAALPALRVEFNADCDGVEVYFTSKPGADTREALKSAGFRWHSVKKCWYAKRTEEHLQALRAIERGAA